MPTDTNRLDVAVFIDFENVYVSVRDKLDANPNFEMIMDRCNELGRVVIARAYADWYRYPRVTSALYANGIEPMYVPTYYYDKDAGRTGRAIKNSVDMNLCIDAMKVLFTNPNISRFVLATGDRDFIPLVNSIRQQGKDVIVIGIGGAASAHLAQSADEFIFYEQLIGKKPISLQQDQPRARMPEKGRDSVDARDESVIPAATPLPAAPAPVAPREKDAEPDIFDVLVRAVHMARERGYICSFGSLKLLMKELLGGEFRESNYRDGAGRSFAKFKDFVQEAERRGKVQVFTSGAVNEVFLPGEDPYKLSKFAADLKEEPPAPSAPTPTIEPEPLISANGAGNGRRRRRRRNQRAIEQAQPRDIDQAEEEIADLPEAQDVGVADGDQPLEEPFEALPEVDLVGDDQLFEQLMDQIRAEDERERQLETMEILTDFDQAGAEPAELPLLIEDQPIALPVDDETPEVLEQPGEPAQTEPANTPVSTAPLEFTTEEWDLLRSLISQYERPLTFVQIHDLMRASRNRIGLTRTNEDLRTLIKQAINVGMLERLGKGSRVSYRLHRPAEETDETGLVEQIAEAVEAPQSEQSQPETPPAETAPTLVEQLAETVEVAAPAAQPTEAQVAELFADEPVPAAETPAAAPEPAAPKKRPSSRRKKPAAEAAEQAEPTSVVEAAQAEPTPAVAQAEAPVAAVETPVPAVEQPEPVTPEPAEAAPKKRAPRRKKAATE